MRLCNLKRRRDFDPRILPATKVARSGAQETEFFKENTAPTPTPIYSFVDDVIKMVDITPPKAKNRPCKLAVVKYKRASK